jgi:hypothetical protein
MTETRASKEAATQFFSKVEVGQAFQEAKVNIKPIFFQVVNVIDR